MGNGWDTLADWTAGKNKLLLPIPADDEVTMEGKCLGWQGTSGPSDLGAFQITAPRATWDGGRQTLTGANFSLDYRIAAFGPSGAVGTYCYQDLTIPSPQCPWITKSPAQSAGLTNFEVLHWRWEGDPQKITGFVVHMNGRPSWWADPNDPNVTMPLPTTCGGSYKFQVTANSGAAQSLPSAPFVFHQNPCPVMVQVKFETIYFSRLDDGEGINDRNDTIEAYYWLHANGDQRYFGDIDMTTGNVYRFHLLGDSSPQRAAYDSYDTFIVPVGFQRSSLRFGVHVKDRDVLYDDHVCAMGIDVVLPFEDWATYEEEFEHICVGGDGTGFITARVKAVPGSAP
jgi:hypothetical protein